MKATKRRVKRRLKILLVIVGMALILLFLFFAPFFNIRSIEVKGSTRYPPEQIKEMSGLMLGENGFRKLKLDAEAILELRLIDSEEKLEQLPYVKACTVSLVFPDKVSIAITEREPAAVIRYLDNYLIVDKEGYVLESSNQRPGGELKEVRGVEFTKYTMGGQLEASDISLIQTAVQIIEAIEISDENTEFKLYEVLDWIDMVDKNNVLMSLDGRIVVRFNPEDKLQYTVDFTKEIFFKKINSTESGRLEFPGDQNPSFIPD